MTLTVTAQAIWIIGASILLYMVYGIVYRFYLSPLASIPGPSLAALTGAYEMYYDLIEKARFP